jgi:hypothetical protein
MIQKRNMYEPEYLLITFFDHLPKDETGCRYKYISRAEFNILKMDETHEVEVQEENLVKYEITSKRISFMEFFHSMTYMVIVDLKKKE